MTVVSETSGTPEPPDKPPAIGFGLQSRDVVPVIALLTGVAATFSGNQPTGNSAADYALSFVFAAAVVWFGQFATAQAVTVSAALGLFFTGFSIPAIAFAACALLVALAITMWRQLDRDSWVISAAFVAALTTQTVLYLPNIGFNTSASILAAITITPIVITGFRNLPERQQQHARRGLVAVMTFAAGATALTAATALSARGQVERGVDQAEDGVTAVEQGDQSQALELLDAAQVDFEQAHDRLSGPLTWPARWVPIAAQHSRALETAAAQGATLAGTAKRTVLQADVDKIRGQNGELDLDLVEAVNAELTLANRTLRAAQQSLRDVNTPWLLPMLGSRLDSVNEELVSTAADIDLANHGTSVLPDMFGANGLRRYMVLFLQPSESREFGGFVGAYGFLEADQGRFELTESGSVDVELGNGPATFTNPEVFPESFLSAVPSLRPQNLTATPDLSTIAAAVRDLTPQWRQDPEFHIDGVITIDPYALAGMLELTGPIVVDGRTEPIDADNVVDFLLRDQYVEFDPVDRAQRQDVLRVLGGQAFNKLLAIEIPGPEKLGAIFGPAARANRLSMVTFNEQENAFLDRIWLSADFPDVGTAVDMVGIYGQTGTASKLDGYASRTATYDVMVNPETGAVTSELVMVESNDAPADAGDYVLGRGDVGGPAGGTLGFGSNFLALGLYTRSTVESLEADTAYRIEDAQPAFSYDRHRIFFEVPLGDSAQVTARMSSQAEPGRYDVYVPAQATALVGEFTLTVRPSQGWRISGFPTQQDGSWTETFTLDEAHGFTLIFERGE